MDLAINLPDSISNSFEIVPAPELGYLWAKAAATPALSTYSVR